MCNTCNSNVFSNRGCRYATSCNYSTMSSNIGCGSSLGCGQRLCRDCNGNIRVINNGYNCYNYCNYCCFQPCCCHCGCGNSGNTNDSNNGGTSGNANNGYGCVIVCGTTANTATTTNDDYYARQYGLNGRNGRSSDRCGCGGWSTF